MSHSSSSTLAKTLVLFGYGPRVSVGIKDRFLAEGYKVVTVSRSAHPEQSTHVVGDLANPATVDAAFKTAIEKYGPVSTVIYNAYSWISAPVEESPFSIPLDQVKAAQDVGFSSAYRAAQLLLESTHPGPKHYLYTGNVMHKEGYAWPKGFVLSLEKGTAALMVEVGAKGYGKKGGPFFYNIWETYPDGKPLYGNVSPEGHADIAFKLVQSAEQSENEVPFVVKDGKAQRAPKDLKFVVDW